jgi:serine/threonine protein phosphatase 1
MTDPVYVVGDIHGRIEFLEHALAWIEADGGAEAPVVFLGDLVDRGPAPGAVIERLMQGQADGRPWQVIKGNHDRMFSRFLRQGIIDDPRIKSGVNWLHPRLGGAATLAAYGVASPEGRALDAVQAEAREKVPARHIDYLDNLPLYVETEALLCVHAGIRPGVALADQTEDDLIWIRDEFLNDTRAHPWLVVHGHTAIDMPFHHGNRVNLDGGAGYGRPIYPAVFEGTQCWLLDQSGRLPLVP